MGPLPEIFFTVFITVAGISAMAGVYIMRIKHSAPENRAFFASTISLAIWALGLGFAFLAPSEQVSIIWRRVAAVGWGTFFSLLLQFTIAFTGKKSLLKKWWIYGLLYLPAAVNIFIFVIPNALNPNPFIMVQTDYGWINVAENNAWDILYVATYISFTAICLALVWQWGLKSAKQSVKRQSRAVLISFFAALALGTATDMAANALLTEKIPQVAPVFILIPIATLYFLMRRYGIFNLQSIKSNEEILSDATRKKLYKYVTVSLIAGSVLNFVTQYVMNREGNLGLTLALSLGLLAAGAAINIVYRLKLGNRQKDLINILGLSLSIPVITMCFLQYGSITVWAFPFLLIIVSLVFNKRVVLFTIAFLIFMTQILVWILSPQKPVMIDDIAFATRLGIFGIGIGLAFFVNRIYTFRLKQNAEQIELQKLVSEISTDFVTANQNNIDEKIVRLLTSAGSFFETDRAYACFFEKNGAGLSCEHVWRTEDKGWSDSIRRSLPACDMPSWTSRILQRDVVQLTGAEELSEHDGNGCIYLMNEPCQSFLSIPVANGFKVLGFLSFVNISFAREWREEHIALLKVLANTLTDAITKVEAEQEINYLAYYDPLTALPNRLMFRDRLTQALLQAGRTGRYLGVVFIDLDSFKSVNDTLGHERGDELLKTIAERLKSSVRQSDTVSRFGADEFLMLINNLVRENDITKVVENVMAQFKHPFGLQGQEFYITASIGIAMYPVDGVDADKLIRNADIAMYSAKEMGKNQYAMCSREMKETVKSNMALTTSLYRALAREEFTIYYQPQVCLQTKRINGLEALLRWRSPEHGMIAPGRFIPLAEQTGIINAIGEWALKEACAQNVRWQAMGLPPVRIAVNLSIIQLRNPKLQDIIQDVLEETGLDPAFLELEITESVATKEPEYIIDLLERLKSLGVKLSIDDFGTEYSSLSRLKMLPVDHIKMDIQFVHGIDGSSKDQAITNVIINLAKNLGLKVIAEGVETESQLSFLHQKMCDEVQGYYYYRPMPADQIEFVLKNDFLRSMGAADSSGT